MEIRNFTPFAVHTSPIEIADKPLTMIMVRGRFRIQHNRRLEPIEDEIPAVVADSLVDVRQPASLRQATNLVPFKAHTDLSLDATAHAPHGHPSPNWLVKFTIGKLSKSLRVTGPRAWVYSPENGWQLDAPRPIEQLPIRYDYAYGGSYRGNDHIVRFEKNPLGRSYGNPRLWPKSGRIPAHQIEAPGGPITVPGRDYQPQGFSPLALDMRRHHQELLAQTTPYTLHQSAHPDLIYPGYLAGKETATLEQLTPSGFLRFELPGYAMLSLVRYQQGTLLPARLFLDTLHLDIHQLIADITWRRAVDASQSIRVLEFRMEQLRGSRLLAL